MAKKNDREFASDLSKWLGHGKKWRQRQVGKPSAGASTVTGH